MLDEKSEVWIKYYKTFTIVMFWIFLFASIIMCFIGWYGNALYITDLPFFNGIICLLIGAFVAFGHLIVNMLIIQFLNNVQLIREKVEKM